MLKSTPDFSSTSRTRTAWRSPVRGRLCVESELTVTRGDLWKCYEVLLQLDTKNISKHINWHTIQCTQWQCVAQIQTNIVGRVCVRPEESTCHVLICFVHRLVVGNIERKPFVAADTCKASDNFHRRNGHWIGSWENVTENPHSLSGKNWSKPYGSIRWLSRKSSIPCQQSNDFEVSKALIGKSLDSTSISAAMKTLAIELKASSLHQTGSNYPGRLWGKWSIKIMSASYQLFPAFFSNVNDRKPNTRSMGAVLDQG